MDFFSVLKLFLGLAFFLFGMSVMSSNLEKLAGGKLEYSLRKVTAKPTLSLLLGAGITIAIQSSSATTVMLVGLVNSGIMQFSQTINIIFGANIGTTLTSWILSLSGIESSSFAVQMLKPENFCPIIALIGVGMTMFSKVDKKRSIGIILTGFTVLMYGMEFMKQAVSPLSELPSFTTLLTRFNNPLFGLLIGIAVTAVIQSSAASIGILQALSLTGSITCGMAIPIVMGQNIGTCATSLISCIGTTKNAKQVATAHISIKIIGALICLPIYLIIDYFTGNVLSNLTVSPARIAMIHTVFNLGITVILMPLSKVIVKLVKKLIPEKEADKPQKESVFMLDERLLRSPSVAVNECEVYTAKMAEIALKTLLNSLDNINSYSKESAKDILDDEDKLDTLEDSLGTFLVKISSQSLSEIDSRRVSKMLHTIGDFERLGDHAVNLLKVSQEMYDKSITFSDEAVAELQTLRSAIEEILNLTISAYINNDIDMAYRVEPLEQVIDRLTAQIKDNHIRRLQNGNCTIELGFVLSDTLTNYERISDHCSNIAVAIIELFKGSFDTHQYLNSIKYGEGRFSALYEEYDGKYSIS